MRIDLSDLDRLDSFAEALTRLFYCLMVVAFFAAILGSPGTGLFLLVLGAAAFVVRVGFEDFVRSRRGTEGESGAAEAAAASPKPEAVAEAADATEEPGITIYRAHRTRRPRSRSKPAV